MHVITQKALKLAWEQYPDAKVSLRKWYTEIKNKQFQNFAELREYYPSSDQVGLPTGLPDFPICPRLASK